MGAGGRARRSDTHQDDRPVFSCAVEDPEPHDGAQKDTDILVHGAHVRRGKVCAAARESGYGTSAGRLDYNEFRLKRCHVTDKALTTVLGGARRLVAMPTAEETSEAHAVADFLSEKGRAG